MEGEALGLCTQDGNTGTVAAVNETILYLIISQWMADKYTLFTGCGYLCFFWEL